MSKGPDKETDKGIDHLAAKATTLLTGLQSSGRLRHLTPTSLAPAFQAGEVIDLTHNDYLDLRRDQSFQSCVHQACISMPIGAGASRLLGGEHPIFKELEDEFAQFKGAPAALFFGSGYAANEAVVTSLARLGGVAFFSDELNHASIIDGIKLSGLPKDARHVYPHNDMTALERALASSSADINIILSETVFSMDGDCAPLCRLQALASRYRGVLVLDEAHAILCLGPGGRGLVVEAGLDQHEIISVNTCGKAMAAQGALVCGPPWFRDVLINTARSFIYTTGPSPWLAMALREVTRQAAGFEGRRLSLSHIAAKLRAGLMAQGFNTLASQTHIIPVLCGSDEHAMSMAAELARHGVLTKAIRPPTVAEGRARLRLSLHAGIQEKDVQKILDAFSHLATTH